MAKKFDSPFLFTYKENEGVCCDLKKKGGGGNSIRDREVLSNGSIKTSSLRATPCLNGRLEASATPSLQVVSVSLVLVPHPLQLPAAEGVYQT